MVRCSYGFLKIGPKGTLVYFTFINFLIYLDRGAIAGVLSTIEDDFGINSALGGLLGSIFILGFMFASPVVAHLAQIYHPLFLIFLGQVVWCLAVIACGVSPNYWVLLCARAFTGVGEASFISLGPPIIMDLAPKRYVTLWLSCIYGVIYLGTAVGFVYSVGVKGALSSWKWPFLIEAILMIPFLIILLIVYKDPSMIVRKKEEKTEGEITSVKDQVLKLLKNPVYLTICIGFGFYMFTIGGLTFWGPTVLYHLFNISKMTAVLYLGASTCICGTIGTIIGSVFVDVGSKKYSRQLQREEIDQVEYDYHRTEICCLILLVSTAIGFGIGMLGIILNALLAFLITLAISELFLFLATGPRSLGVMTCTSPELRGQANAISIFFMHLLGDFPSPYIIGVLIDAWGYYWGMFTLLLVLSVSLIFWLISWHFSVRFM